MGRSRDWSLPQSAGFQVNLEGIHVTSRTMYEILQKMSGGLLILRLAYVYPKGTMLLVLTTICETSPLLDDIVSYSAHKVQPPYAENVVCEDDIILIEGPEA